MRQIIPPMHLLIPFASALPDAAAAVLREIRLPNLSQLLVRLDLAARDDADEHSLSPPHERAIAAAAGWHGADGCLPFAAQAAERDGIQIGDAAWGLVTPSHWHVGRTHVTLADPAALALTESESRAAFEAVRTLFESEGFRIERGAASRWYIAHESLNDLPCASLDRVIGHNVEGWMRGSDARSDALKRLRRLQSEWQMLLYPHLLNEARESAGGLSLNSFWLSGCGRRQPDADHVVMVDDRLRAPALAEDWTAWGDAWQALDASVLPALLDAAGNGTAAALTLCGERGAHRFEAAPRSLWRRLGERWQNVAPHTALGLI